MPRWRWQGRLEPSHAGLQHDAAQFLGLLLDNPEPCKPDPPDLRRRRARDDEPRLFRGCTWPDLPTRYLRSYTAAEKTKRADEVARRTAGASRGARRYPRRERPRVRDEKGDRLLFW